MTHLIETKRLILREFTINDAAAVYEFNSNPEVQKYTGDELIDSIERAKELIVNISLKEYKNYGYGRWAVIYKPDNKIIGFAGLKYLPKLNETDIGFRFLPQFWGIGIATEASREIIKYGFKNFGLNSIIGIAMPQNIGSCKVLEKLGFHLYKIDEYDGDGGSYRWYKLERSKYII